MERNKPRIRGRPRSEGAGASDAFDEITRYIQQNNISLNQLAIRCALTPSSVTRALSAKETARWTPTFRTIYSIAKKNEVGTRISPAMKRLAAYEGPGEAEVKRLLDDVEALIATLSTSAR
jgi:transcriptional regulator with XRE-family HTH domain